MSDLSTTFLLVVSSAVDTLAVGLAYGTRKYRLPFVSNLICAAIPCLGTYLMMVSGVGLRNIIPTEFISIPGAGIIIITGVVLILQYCRKQRAAGQQKTCCQFAVQETIPKSTVFPNIKDLGEILENPFRVDYNYSGSIELKEAMILALALTLNNLSCGLAAGLMGLNISLTVGALFFIGLLFFYTGMIIGRQYMAHWFGKNGDLIAGVILLVIGVCELL